MRRLYLFRHGLAYPHGTEGFEDDERPLTEKGERRVRQVARFLKRLGLKLDKLVTSPLPRALRTAEIAADVLGKAFLLEEADALRPASSPESIKEWLATRGESRIMLVGHNPNLSELLTLLTTGQTNPTVLELRKGGVAALRDDPTGQYRIEWLSRPRLVRRLSD
jgi:phosphohistidine phosphatase